MLTLALVIAIFILVAVRLERRAAQKFAPPFRLGREKSRLTTMDRLASAGLFGDFDAAVQGRDLDAMVAILQQIDVPLPQALAISEAILEDPAKFPR